MRGMLLTKMVERTWSELSGDSGALIGSLSRTAKALLRIGLSWPNAATTVRPSLKCESATSRFHLAERTKATERTAELTYLRVGLSKVPRLRAVELRSSLLARS